MGGYSASSALRQNPTEAMTAAVFNTRKEPAVKRALSCVHQGIHRISPTAQMSGGERGRGGGGDEKRETGIEEQRDGTARDGKERKGRSEQLA